MGEKRATLDPNKFSVTSKGEIVITDPEFSRQVRKAKEEAVEESGGEITAIHVTIDIEP